MDGRTDEQDLLKRYVVASEKRDIKLTSQEGKDMEKCAQRRKGKRKNDGKIERLKSLSVKRRRCE